jgi:4-hydroxyphenylpyruvate dioxygenase
MVYDQFDKNHIDYIEIYAPMAKPLAYWHMKALGFSISAYAGIETGKPGYASYLLTSANIALVITATYPVNHTDMSSEICTFTGANSCGIKRIAFRVDSVKDMFYSSVERGAIPLKFPTIVEDEAGRIEEAAVKLFDHNEIVFINRDNYGGIFRPGYKMFVSDPQTPKPLFNTVDHIASELRINEVDKWTEYLAKTIHTELIQKVEKSEQNLTGMKMNMSLTPDKESIFVMSESESHNLSSRVQQSVEKFGPGMHHIAFTTDDIISTIKELRSRSVDLVNFPAAYYDLLRQNKELEGIDIDALQEQGILVDKEGDSYLFQKFLKPMGDRPYFFYEVIQRVNGYSGFALNNIVALRKAEEIQITQVAQA